jgi:superfamily II DNA helicase RecQ
VFAITFDESHCISEWGDSFRPEYGDIGNLRWILPAHIPFHITSATMPPHILQDVKRKLQIRSDAVEIIHSNDRPNIYLRVEEMKYPVNTKWDLLRVLRLDPNAEQDLFMVFANSRKETESVAQFLRSYVTERYRDKIVWFHSGMSAKFRQEAIENLRTGKIWGICCTDAAGMVCD